MNFSVNFYSLWGGKERAPQFLGGLFKVFLRGRSKARTLLDADASGRNPLLPYASK